MTAWVTGTSTRTLTIRYGHDTTGSNLSTWADTFPGETVYVSDGWRPHTPRWFRQEMLRGFGRVPIAVRAATEPPPRAPMAAPRPARTASPASAPRVHHVARQERGRVGWRRVRRAR